MGRLRLGSVKANGVVRCICMMRCRGSLCVCRVMLGRDRWVPVALGGHEYWGKVILGNRGLFMFRVIFLKVVGGCFFRVADALVRRILMGFWMCMSGSGRGWGRVGNPCRRLGRGVVGVCSRFRMWRVVLSRFLWMRAGVGMMCLSRRLISWCRRIRIPGKMCMM